MNYSIVKFKKKLGLVSLVVLSLHLLSPVTKAMEAPEDIEGTPAFIRKKVLNVLAQSKANDSFYEMIFDPSKKYILEESPQHFLNRLLPDLMRLSACLHKIHYSSIYPGIWSNGYTYTGFREGEPYDLTQVSMKHWKYEDYFDVSELKDPVGIICSAFLKVQRRYAELNWMVGIPDCFEIEPVDPSLPTPNLKSYSELLSEYNIEKKSLSFAIDSYIKSGFLFVFEICPGIPTATSLKLNVRIPDEINEFYEYHKTTTKLKRPDKTMWADFLPSPRTITLPETTEAVLYNNTVFLKNKIKKLRSLKDAHYNLEKHPMLQPARQTVGAPALSLTQRIPKQQRQQLVKQRDNEVAKQEREARFQRLQQKKSTQQKFGSSVVSSADLKAAEDADRVAKELREGGGQNQGSKGNNNSEGKKGKQKEQAEKERKQAEKRQQEQERLAAQIAKKEKEKAEKKKQQEELMAQQKAEKERKQEERQKAAEAKREEEKRKKEERLAQQKAEKARKREEKRNQEEQLVQQTEGTENLQVDGIRCKAAQLTPKELAKMIKKEEKKQQRLRQQAEKEAKKQEEERREAEKKEKESKKASSGKYLMRKPHSESLLPLIKTPLYVVPEWVTPGPDNSKLYFQEGQNGEKHVNIVYPNAEYIGIRNNYLWGKFRKLYAEACFLKKTAVEIHEELRCDGTPYSQRQLYSLVGELKVNNQGGMLQLKQNELLVEEIKRLEKLLPANNPAEEQKIDEGKDKDKDSKGKDKGKGKDKH